MESLIHIFLGGLLILSALGILIAKRPVYAALSFLGTLLLLAVHYLLLSAQFIAVMQILVYAGAILVLFIFVMMLFQDTYLHIHEISSRSSRTLVSATAAVFIVAIGAALWKLLPVSRQAAEGGIPESFGTAESIGRELYTGFFFPFEAILLLFLVGIVGAVYLARKENRS